MKLIMKLGFLMIFVFYMIFAGCTNSKDLSIDSQVLYDNLVTAQHSVYSPSGLYELKMNLIEQDHIQGFVFSVYDVSTDQEIFKSNDYFRLRDTHFLMWGKQDEIWVYSGDIGTFYWEKTESWNKKSYSENKANIKPPELLKQLRPEYFK